MKQPGIDGRHRDNNGQIDLKHGNTKNKNLPSPIAGFKPNTTLSEMREQTGSKSESGIRKSIATQKK